MVPGAQIIVLKEVVECKQMPPWHSREGMVGRGPEWGPLKHEIQDRGPSIWGPRPLLAESRGFMCYVLKSPKCSSHQVFSRNGRYPAGSSCLDSPLCGLGLILQPVRSMLPIKYTFPPRLAINQPKILKEIVVNLVSDTSLISFQLLNKYFNRCACLSSTF